MDSGSGRANPKLQAIKQALQNGSLTKEEIADRLSRAISMEYLKQPGERDARFILACEKLLYEMHTGAPYASGKEEKKQALQKRLAEEETGKRGRLSPLWRWTAAACAVVLLVLGVQLFTHREWLEGLSTRDEQQYVISGVEADPVPMKSGVADGGNGIQSMYTSDLDEVIALLGFSPQLPTQMPDGWTVREYHVLINASSQMISAAYVNDAFEKEILYNIMYYSEIEGASSWVEQNLQGDVVLIENSKVYFSHNIDNNLCAWYNGTICYKLFGPVPQEQLISILQSIKE